MGNFARMGMAALVLMPVAAAAEEAPPAPEASQGLSDIVVTAQRKSERLQEVPIAVSVIGGGDLAARGVRDVVALSTTVPGLEYTVVGPTPTPYLRGVGSPISTPNAESSVALYVDGVYQPYASANMAGNNNVERVEVLKGPQGTLFGRNATAGVIQIITRDPGPDSELEARLGYESYRTILGSAYVNQPLSSTVSANLALNIASQDKGWGTSVTSGKEIHKRKEVSVRGKLLWAPDAETSAKLMLSYRRSNSVGYEDYRLADGARALDGSPPPPGRYDTLSNEPGGSLIHQYGASLTINHDMDAVRLVSISSWGKTRHTAREDIDASSLTLLHWIGPARQRNLSQELQLMSQPGSNIDWVIGGFYYDNKVGYYNTIYSGLFAGSNTTAFQRTRSIAAYAQATYELVDKLKLTAGLRYTDERQKVTGTTSDLSGVVLVPRLSQKQSFTKPTWRLALDYGFTSDVHGYVSYNRGVKSGGFALLSYTDPGYKPEVLDAYEVGLKSELFDRRLRLNLAGFIYDFNNLQVEVTPAGSVKTLNAASARIYGGELEFMAKPLPDLVVSGGYTYVHGRYKKFIFAAPYNPASALDPNPFPNGFDASGKTTLQTPENSAFGSATYTIPSAAGNFSISGTVRYYDKMAYNVFNDFVRHPYTLVNASIGWTSSDDGLGVRAYVRNLTKAYSTAQGVATGLGWLSSPIEPRIFGVEVSKKF